MKISLKNKTALIGGSTQGLGKAIAIQLAQCGANVIVMARNEEKLKAVVSELSCEENQKHSYLVVDFSNIETFKNTITDFFKTNTIDILVNNTNGPAAGTALEKNINDYQEAFDLLFKTVCHTTLEAIPHMKNNNFGRIINVSSISVKEPIQHLILSNTIRSGVVSWAKTLAAEIAPYGITVNTILTGYFDTERLNQLIENQSVKNNIDFLEVKDKMIQQVPVKRLGKPEEFGHLAAFLSSDYASYITGTKIPIDGGLLKSV